MCAIFWVRVCVHVYICVYVCVTCGQRKYTDIKVRIYYALIFSLFTVLAAIFHSDSDAYDSLKRLDGEPLCLFIYIIIRHAALCHILV